MNKFRNVGSLQGGKPTVRVNIARPVQGARLDASALDIPIESTQDLNNIRFIDNEIAKDLGFVGMGEETDDELIGLIEHRFFSHGSVEGSIFRFVRVNARLAIDQWTSVGWERIIEPEKPIGPEISIVSILGLVAIADGDRIYYLKEDVETSDHLQYFAGEGQEIYDEDVYADTFAEPDEPYILGEPVEIHLESFSVLDRYTINGSVTPNFSSGHVDLEVHFKDELVHQERVLIFEKDEPREFSMTFVMEEPINEPFPYNFIVTATPVADKLAFEPMLTALQDVEFEEVDPEGTVFENYSVNSTQGETSVPATEQYEAVLDAIAIDGNYTFRYELVHDTDQFLSEAANHPYRVHFYLRVGGLLFLLNVEEHTGEDLDETHEVTLTEYVEPQFLRDATLVIKIGHDHFSAEDASGVFVVEFNPLSASYRPSPKIHLRGYNEEDPEAGLIYPIGEISRDYVLELAGFGAPSARYLFSFGDRLFALHDLGDPQILYWTTDGDVEEWVGGDAGDTGLLDTHIDPVDDLMGGAPLGEGVAALFRRRSIMRVVETGNAQLPVAVSSWMEGIGTDSPWSITIARGGICFLGHDRIVYYLTTQNIVPIGRPIRPAIDSDDIRGYRGAYDHNLGEYYLCTPDGVTWIFNLTKFLTTQEMEWRRRDVHVKMIASITQPTGVHHGGN